MDPSIWMLFIVYIAFILIGAYLAACESAFAAVNKIKMKNLADAGDRRAKKVLFIVNNFNRAITTMLVGINVAHIGGASLGTIIAVKLFAEHEDTATLVATILTTVIMFLISEMLPKSFAKSHAEVTSLALAPSMRALMTLLYPIALFFNGITKLVSIIFKPKAEPTITEEELVDIIETAEEEGGIDEHQSELLQSALEFGDTTVSDVLTLREDIEAIDIALPFEELLEVVRKTTRSRLPVYEGDIDNIIGMLHVRRFLSDYIRHNVKNIREILSPVCFVSPKQPIDELLTRMGHERITLAIVCDKEGKTLGLVTVEDFLEELVGEIWDETDVVNEDFISLGGNRYEVSSDVTLDEMFDGIGYSSPRAFNAARADMSVGEWAEANLGDSVEEEDEFTFDTLEVEVEEVEDGKVTKIIVKTPNPELEAAVEEETEMEEAAEASGDNGEEEAAK